jgi:hypothetical protein
VYQQDIRSLLLPTQGDVASIREYPFELRYAVIGEREIHQVIHRVSSLQFRDTRGCADLRYEFCAQYQLPGTAVRRRMKQRIHEIIRITIIVHPTSK